MRVQTLFTRVTVLRLVGACAVVLPPLLIAAGVVPPHAVLGSLFALFWLLLRLLGGHAPGLMVVFLIAALASTVATRPMPNFRAHAGDARDGAHAVVQWREKQPFRDLPIYVHVVFDEMMSTGAIPGEGIGPQVRQSLYSLERHGVRTFDSIYSRRYYSGVSLPNMMNAEFEGDFGSDAERSAIQTSVSNNSYFAEMARRGYRTAVFQTAVMDFCTAQEVTWCETFRSFDPASGVAQSRTSSDRVLSLSESMLRVYEPGGIPQLGLEFLHRSYGVGGQQSRIHGTAGRYDPQGFVPWFQRFLAFLEEAPRGSHVFAHFLVPHAPYLLSAGCDVGGTVSTGYSLAKQEPAQERRVALKREQYAEYLDQLGCVAAQLDGMFTRLGRLERYRDATIIVHGDHGSRISNGFAIEEVDERDLVDNYATYFAVKAPVVSAGVDCRFQSLPQVFRMVVRGVDAVEEPVDVLVALRGSADERVPTRMPLFGCAARTGE